MGREERCVGGGGGKLWLRLKTIKNISLLTITSTRYHRSNGASGHLRETLPSFPDQQGNGSKQTKTTSTPSRLLGGRAALSGSFSC